MITPHLRPNDLVRFHQNPDLHWQPLGDRVMGGESDGALVHPTEGVGLFHGTVRPDNGGGFASVKADGAQPAMTTKTFALTLQRPFKLRMTVESDGWCQLAPWHWDGERLERTVKIGANAEWARIHQPADDQLLVETTSSSTDAVSERVARWLHLDWDPSGFLAL